MPFDLTPAIEDDHGYAEALLKGYVGTLEEWKEAVAFAPIRAERNIRWIEENLFVPEGELVGKPLRLYDYQKDMIRRIYDNPYRTRRYMCSFPRKNAKTTLTAAVLALHVLGPESLPNAQTYCISLKKKQAGIIFNLLVKMITPSPKLRPHVKVYERELRLTVPKRGTTFESLAKDKTGGSLQGFSAAFFVWDEGGEVNAETDAMFSALDKSQGAYKNSLQVLISTQASRKNFIYNRLLDDGRSGADPRVVVDVFECPPDVDPFSEEALKLANPAYGCDFFDIEGLRATQAEAKRNPPDVPEFRNKHLNQRVQTDAPFLAESFWEELAGEVEDWHGKQVVVSIDLSRVRDLSSMTILSLNEDGQKYSIHPHFWLPEEAIAEKETEDGFQYTVWNKKGHIEFTPGNTIDYRFIAHRLKYIHENCEIQKIVVDKWNINSFKAAMIEVGLSEDMYEELFFGFYQNPREFDPAIRTLEVMIRNKLLVHPNNNVMNWCFSNVTVKETPDEKRRFVKQARNLRIDGMITLAMGIGIIANYDAMKPVERGYMSDGLGLIC